MNRITFASLFFESAVNAMNHPNFRLEVRFLMENDHTNPTYSSLFASGTFPINTIHPRNFPMVIHRAFQATIPTITINHVTHTFTIRYALKMATGESPQTITQSFTYDPLTLNQPITETRVLFGNWHMETRASIIPQILPANIHTDPLDRCLPNGTPSN